MSDAAYAAAVAYVTTRHVPETALAAAAGLSGHQFAHLAEAGVVPQPTYRVGPAGVASSIGRIGAPPGPEARGYYGPAVVHWLRRAAVLAERLPARDLGETLEQWLAADLGAALAARPDDAMAYGWSHVLRGGHPDPRALRDEVASYRDGWRDGGWAVCLRRFDGHHLVTKEIERRRIAALTEEGRRPALAPAERLAVLDAMIRLDSVLLPFAPHERPTGTPGRFIDSVAERYALPYAPRATTSESPAAHHA